MSQIIVLLATLDLNIIASINSPAPILLGPIKTPSKIPKRPSKIIVIDKVINLFKKIITPY